MYKIQTLDKIAAIGLEKLPRETYEVATEIGHPDGIILRSFKMHDMVLPETLKAIARAGAGVNNIPIDTCTAKGIVVFNTPGANANGVKELALTAMLISSRKIVEGINWSRSLAGGGDEVPAMVEKGKSTFVGPEIMGKTMGVVGLGAIGVMVANMSAALGMKVIGYDPFISVDAAWGLSPEILRAQALESLLRDADFVSIHVPFNEHTKGLINEKSLEHAKRGVRIINLSRGGLVNNKDMKAALASGNVSVYVTDFPDEELVQMDGVIPLPHLGASTPEAEDNCAIMAASQMRDFLENGNIKNSVNFPAVHVDRTSGTNRIVIANKNVPNMVGQISSVIAQEGVNIMEMVNKGRDNVAYNIIDTKDSVPSSLLEKICAIDGIIMARVL